MLIDEITLPVVVLCIITGGFTAWMAKRKGYEPVPWFVCGFFLSVIGIALIASRKRKSNGVN